MAMDAARERDARPVGRRARRRAVLREGQHRHHGLPTTCGSRILEGYMSPYEATALVRLRAAGADARRPRRTCDEFAMGSSTEHCAYGPGEESARPHARARRLVRRLGGGRRCRHRPASRSARRPAARCGSPRRSAASSASSRPTGASAASVSWRSRRRSTTSRVRRARWTTRRSRSKSSRATIRSTTRRSALAPPAPACAAARDGDLAGVVIGRPKEYFPDVARPRVTRRTATARSTRCARAARRCATSRSRTPTSPPGLLHRRAGGMLVEPRPLRRRALRAAHRGRWTARHVRGHALPRIRRRGDAPHPARHLRALRRLLRRVLPQGAGRARADRARFHAACSASGVPRAVHADDAAPAFTFGAIVRSVRDVPVRHLHRDGEPRRACRRCRCRSAGSDGLPVGGQVIAPRFGEQAMFRIAYALEARTRRGGAPMSATDATRWSSGSRCTCSSRRATKAFCRCSTSFGDPPNTNTCPVCLALPGALPVLNERAVELAVRAALALGLRRARAVGVRAQELLLSRPAQGIPDLAVRPAARGARHARDRRPDGRDHRRHHAHAHGGGRGQVRARPLPRLHRDRPQSRRRAADRDRERAGHPQQRGGRRVSARAAARSCSYAEVSRLLDGGGEPARGRERERAAASARRRSRTQDRDQEHEFRSPNVERALELEFARQCAVLDARRARSYQQTMLFDARTARCGRRARRRGATTTAISPSPTSRRSCSRARGSRASRAGCPNCRRARARAVREAYALGDADAEVLTASRAVADYFETRRVDRGRREGRRQLGDGRGARLLQRGGRARSRECPRAGRDAARRSCSISSGTAR